MSESETVSRGSATNRGSNPQTIDDVEVEGRRVLVRVDFNVPIEDGRIVDDRRIRAALPTIQALRSRGARVVLVTHCGRPGGVVDSALSVRPLALRLGELLDCEVPVAADVVGSSARAHVADLAPGDVMMVENARFEPGEERNDPLLAASLASLADLYCDDAFGVAHRDHASTEGVAHLLPAVAGYLMAEELAVLGRILEAPDHPVVGIIGGSKISTKLAVIRSLADRVETLWIGGAMACTFYRSLGVTTGSSLVEPDQISVAGDLLERARVQRGRGVADVRLPVDVVVAPSRNPGVPTRVVRYTEIPDDMMVVDIGPDTVIEIARSCQDAATVVWNGPLGIYEVEAFARGTRSVAQTLAGSTATTVIGGGDLGAAVEDAGVADRMSFMSTGGGATLEFLEGRTLPGVAVLRQRHVDLIEAGIASLAPTLTAAPVGPPARVPLVVGNWKMNTTIDEGLSLCDGILAAVDGTASTIEVVILPPFVHLWAVHQRLRDGGRLSIGAQDVFWEEAGAWTGEISPTMLRGWCDYVLIGHSERRRLGETDDQVNRKLRAALTHDLRVVVAVGETLEQHQAGASLAVVRDQLDAAFDAVSMAQLERCVVAYEPVWAIGSGRTATPEQAQVVCACIRERLAQRFSAGASAGVRILYGGSVNPNNAGEIFGQPDIDGGLIGGASLVVGGFAAILRAAVPAGVVAG